MCHYKSREWGKQTVRGKEWGVNVFNELDTSPLSYSKKIQHTTDIYHGICDYAMRNLQYIENIVD